VVIIPFRLVASVKLQIKKARNFKLLGSVGVGHKKKKYSKVAAVFVFFIYKKMKYRNKFSIQQINQEHLTAHERDKSSETDRRILWQSDIGERTDL